MNKTLLRVLSLTMACTIALPIFASCKPEENSSSGGQSSGYNNETDALVFSSGEFDGVFNPFFSTSAYDGEIQGQTQISMLTADDNGEKVQFGKDYPVVALDYSETMYDEDGNVSAEGDLDGTTVYQMVLKKGIKFSDGVELTAHDVLFNMYVYLDPNYTGSSTMYSTDIVGLKNYQNQKEGELTDGAQAALENTFDELAKLRIRAISTYVDVSATQQQKDTAINTYNSTASEQEINRNYDATKIQADIATIKTEWINEITTDWNAASSDLASAQKEYPFSEPWQLYFLNEGLISLIRDTSIVNAVVYKKDAAGKYLIDWQGYENASFTKETAIAEVKNNYLGVNLDRDAFVGEILGGWATASTMRTLFASQDKQLYYEARKVNGELAVPNISGIKILPASEFNGTKLYPSEDYSQYEMLQVTINGVDPKAKWNFAFSVAPMHYYSTPELTAAALADTNYESNFGVEFSSADFMNQVKRRNKVPMGAGLYKASTMNDYEYDWSKDSESFATLADGFLKDNVCYFQANEYFYTTGGNTEAVYNAKIKHIQYKVVNSANTMTALQGGAIHYADPSATQENIQIVTDHSDLDRIMSKTSGYGYIGINAKFIPNINIRRALMSAMDISLVQSYYPGTLSEPIYRPFSKVSWVYNAFPNDGVEAWNPENIDGEENKQYYPFYKKADGSDDTARIQETIRDYLLDGDCEYVNGKWYDEEGNLLKYTFTVAGETTDHPAYQTFLKARNILNNMGWEVEVLPDARALFKLASGGLAIWAAAWSAALDPDMYQVYHKNSKATSVQNWGYGFLKDNKNTYSEQWGIIEDISANIDEARETLDPATRAGLYREASDWVMDLAVELPVYQRSDMFVYNKTVLDASTFKQNITSYAGPLSEMWKVSFI